MEPTEEEIEVLSKELYRIWRDTPDDAYRSFDSVARHVLSRPAPPGTTRLGTGLTETQRGWSADRKRREADAYAAAAKAFESFFWDLSTDGFVAWQPIHNRLRDIAADLRAAAEPPPDPRIAVVQDTIGRLARTGVPSTDETRAILAALDKMGGRE